MAALTSTPTKRDHSGKSIADVSPYASRLPSFHSTGEFFTDERAKTDHIQLQSMIDGCLKNRQLIPICFGKFTEAMKALVCNPVLDRSAVFAPPAPKNLMGLPIAFLIQWLVSKTDMTADMLLAFTQIDKKAIHRLFLAKVQLPEGLRMDGELQNVAVLKRILDARDVHCGERLKHVCRDKYVQGNKIYWLNCGAYRPKFDEGKLVEVTHMPSGHIAVVDAANFVITDCAEWQLVDNWSDVGAEYQYSGEPGKKLSSFFKKDTFQGPWGYTFYTGSKQTSFQAMLELNVNGYIVDKEKVSASSSSEAMVQQKVQDASKVAAQASMSKVKAAAKVALGKAKKARCAEAVPLAPVVVAAPVVADD
jgi:hypothetical protein